MALKGYLQPYLPGNPRLLSMGKDFAIERGCMDPQLDDAVANAMAGALYGLFSTMVRGANSEGYAFNITPFDATERNSMATALFERLPIRPQDQEEAYPLLMQEFRRLALLPGFVLPRGAQLEAGADCIILHPNPQITRSHRLQ